MYPQGEISSGAQHWHEQALHAALSAADGSVSTSNQCPKSNAVYESHLSYGFVQQPPIPLQEPQLQHTFNPASFDPHAVPFDPFFHAGGSFTGAGASYLS
jgi:hypothetical protein